MWIILSLISAFALSVRDIAIKKEAVTGSPLLVSIAMLGLLLPLLTGIILWKNHFDFTQILILQLFFASLMDALGIFLYSKSLQSADLSITTPILAFIPVFQVIFSFIFLNQTVSVPGIFGIGLSIGFILYGSKFSFQKIIHDQSSLFMLGVAFCWGGSSLLHKSGASYFGALLWTSYVCIVTLVILIVYACFFDRKAIRLSQVPHFWLPALSHFVTLVCFYGAAALGNVAYVSSIRRLSILFSFVSGIVIFKERYSKQILIRMFGLILSALIIILFG